MKSNKWNQNVMNFLVRKKFICFLKYISYILFIYRYTKVSTVLDKDLRKNIKEKKKR